MYMYTVYIVPNNAFYYRLHSITCQYSKPIYHDVTYFQAVQPSCSNEDATPSSSSPKKMRNGWKIWTHESCEDNNMENNWKNILYGEMWEKQYKQSTSITLFICGYTSLFQETRFITFHRCFFFPKEAGGMGLWLEKRIMMSMMSMSMWECRGFNHNKIWGLNMFKPNIYLEWWSLIAKYLLNGKEHKCHEIPIEWEWY